MNNVDIPAKHSSSCILCTADANAICWRWSTSLLSMLFHTVKMCSNDAAQVSGYFLCAKIDANATHWTIALEFINIMRIDDTVSVQFVTQLSELYC